MTTPTTDVPDGFIEEFVTESNAIEGVYEQSAIDTSLDAWNHLIQQETLTESAIKTTHNILLEDRQPDIAGHYRNIQVYINNERPPEPAVVPALMEQLLEWTPTTEDEIVKWHILFEQIHPFTDGNGRLGRLIYLYHSLSANIEPTIWRESERQDYYTLFDSTVHRDSGIDTVTINQKHES